MEGLCRVLGLVVAGDGGQKRRERVIAQVAVNGGWRSTGGSSFKLGSL